jgi:hypothetical protein
MIYYFSEKYFPAHKKQAALQEIFNFQDNKINWKCEVTNYRRDITQNVCRILISKVESDASRPYITQW